MTFGRFNELNHETALNYKWPTGDGYQWFTQAPGKGLLTGQTPQLGACACWWYYKRDSQGNPVLDPQGNVIPTGHTAIVEAIHYNGNNWDYLITSNSAWWRSDPDDDYSDIGDPVEGYPYWYLRNVYRGSMDSVSGHPEAYFQGFVYHPKFPPGQTPAAPASLLAALIGGNKRTPVKIIRKRGVEQ